MQEIVNLKRASELHEPGKPTISLALTVRPEISGTEIAQNLLPHVDEIVVVLLDDSSRQIWQEYLESLPIPGTLILGSPSSRPHLYFKDLPESYTEGKPLGDESHTGPYSELPIVADWSALRNLGLSRCGQEWRLALRDDEQLRYPEYLRHVCQSLDAHCRDVAYLPHQRGPRNHYRAVLVRNRPEISFEGAARESIEGGVRPAIVRGSLEITSPSCPLDDARDWKTLYAEARRSSWNVSPTNLLHLAKLADAACTPAIAEPAISTYLDNSLYPEERAWALSLRGERLEAEGKLEEAASSYRESLAEHAGWKAALRLSRATFKLARWQDCLDAYVTACSTLSHAHICDDGPESIANTLILLAGATSALGRQDEAKEICDKLRLLFPNSSKVQALCDLYCP